MVQKANNYTRSITSDDFKMPTTQERMDHIARSITRKESHQKAAASLTDSFIARAPGRIKAARVLQGGAAAASGESMVVDVQIAGSTALDATETLDDTTAQDEWIEAAVDPASAEFSMGDLVEIIRTYTAGGGPTPMTNTLVEVDVEYDR